MKNCPLCGATCFDDMDVCYCCMHRFEEDEGELSERRREGNGEHPGKRDERELAIREREDGGYGRSAAWGFATGKDAGEDAGAGAYEGTREDASACACEGTCEDTREEAGEKARAGARKGAGEGAGEDADEGNGEVWVKPCAPEASASNESNEGRCKGTEATEESEAGKRDETFTVTASSDSGERRHPPIFAFGPTIDTLEGVGGCVRIDIPLRAITEMLIAARAAEQESDWADLPPAA